MIGCAQEKALKVSKYFRSIVEIDVMLKTEKGFTKEGLENSLTVPIPTLAKVGLLDLFPPDEWIAGTSAGRKFVGMKAKEMGY